jgi:hypothetical protein
LAPPRHEPRRPAAIALLHTTPERSFGYLRGPRTKAVDFLSFTNRTLFRKDLPEWIADGRYNDLDGFSLTLTTSSLDTDSPNALKHFPVSQQSTTRSNDRE